MSKFGGGLCWLFFELHFSGFLFEVSLFHSLEKFKSRVHRT
jgi:hypothetical protein